MDVIVEELVIEVVDKVFKVFGGSLDVLIVNVGYLLEWRFFVEFDLMEWWKIWEINIKGIYFCVKFFILLLLELFIKIFIIVFFVGVYVLFYGVLVY